MNLDNRRIPEVVKVAAEDILEIFYVSYDTELGLCIYMRLKGHPTRWYSVPFLTEKLIREAAEASLTPEAMAVAWNDRLRENRRQSGIAFGSFSIKLSGEQADRFMQVLTGEGEEL